jgi:hypothetical protein
MEIVPCDSAEWKRAILLLLLASVRIDKNAHRSRFLGQSDCRDPALEDTGLLCSNLLDGVAEHMRVI